MKTLLFPALKGFIIHKDKVLIIRESSKYISPNQGKYDLPGGKIKPGENISQALKREAKEEVGLDIQLGKPFSISEWAPIVSGNKHHIVGTFIECFADSAKVKLDVCYDDYKWIIPSEYEKYNIIDTLLPVFKDYLNRNKSNRKV